MRVRWKAKPGSAIISRHKWTALAHRKTGSGGAHQAVTVLVRYIAQERPVQPNELVGGEGDVTIEVESGVPLKYSNLPALTPGQFDALVLTARKPIPKRRPISDRSIAMARAVLLDGATYVDAGLGQGGTASASKHAVLTLLRYWNWSYPVQPHNVFAKTTA